MWTQFHSLIHKCRPQDLMVTMVRPSCCYCKCLSEWSLLSHKSKSFEGTLEGLRQSLITESPLKKKKNAFYLTLKALFILKVFKFLSFGHVEKTTQLERYG